MVELVADLGRRHVADNLGIRRRFRIDVDDRDAVRGFSVGIEGRDIGERFGRCLRRLARRGLKTWIGCPGGHVIFSSRDLPASSCPRSSRMRKRIRARPNRSRAAPVFSERDGGLKDGRGWRPPARAGVLYLGVPRREAGMDACPLSFFVRDGVFGCLAATGTATGSYRTRAQQKWPGRDIKASKER